VIDAGQVDDIAYIAMECLEGSNLRELLAAQGVLPISDVVRFALHVCEGLQEAHGHNIVHRDIKPSNLFVSCDDDGDPCLKILDFGVSKIGSPTHAREAFTETGALLGTPLYMAPEQLRSARAADVRSDIWSLGATLFECIAGRPAFEAESLAGLGASIVSDEPPSLLEVRPDVPTLLAEIVARCLQKDPAARFASVADLSRALETLYTQLPALPAATRAAGAGRRASSEDTMTEDTTESVVAEGFGAASGLESEDTESNAGPTQTSVTVPLSGRSNAAPRRWLALGAAVVGLGAWLLGSGVAGRTVQQTREAGDLATAAAPSVKGAPPEPNEVATAVANAGGAFPGPPAASASLGKSKPPNLPPTSTARGFRAKPNGTRAINSPNELARPTGPKKVASTRSKPSASVSSSPAVVSSSPEPLEFRD
jgi:serine/threonine-protein kinase